MKKYEMGEQITIFGPDSEYGRMYLEPSAAETPKVRTSASSSRNSSALVTAPYMCLDHRPGAGNLLGPCWEINALWLGEYTTLNTGPAPHSGAAGYILSQILQDSPPPKYYLSSTACLGILRRAKKRGKELPPVLKQALEIQSTINIKDYVMLDAKGCEIIAFACNQRDEVRNLHDVAGAIQAQPGMKQQTFVLNPWDTQQARVSVPEGVTPTLCGADGGGGRNPAGLIMAQGVVSKGDGDVFLTDEVHTSLTSGGGQAGQGYPCVLTAGFCAGASGNAKGIGYQEEIAPTLKSGGGNGMPSVICLNDQGGQIMNASENIAGTLRAQMHSHQPLVLASQQNGAESGMDICHTITAVTGMSGNNQPVLFENHGIDSRYAGPHEVSPTLSARMGTGGNNQSLVAQDGETFCIAGNVIDRQPQNGGNGLGCQSDISYTITATDKHAVFSQQRSDEYIENAVASTQSARQYKDATDLVYQQTVGTLVASDKKGPNNQYVNDDKCIIMPTNFIRRLTPLECERLQGFPDFWTDIPGTSDSARYKALGNSVAIPCVEHVLRGVSYFLTQGGDDRA